MLGYCIFPLVVAAFLCFLWSNIVYQLIVVSVAFMWATKGGCACCGVHCSPGVTAMLTLPALRARDLRPWLAASVVFMSQLVPEKRKALAVFPVLLFYVFIGWMILIQ